MAYIPADARWFLAELVEESRIEGEVGNVLDRNLMLIEASSSEMAHKRALDLGKEHEVSYQNSEGRKVTVHFRGISHLDVIHDSLEHGAELSFRRSHGMDEATIQSLIPAKNELSAFAPTETGDLN